MNHRAIEVFSKIICPVCNHTEQEEMPTDACQFFYECKNCGAMLSPLPGDCCVYCSFGDTSCKGQDTEPKSAQFNADRNSVEIVIREIEAVYTSGSPS